MFSIIQSVHIQDLYLWIGIPFIDMYYMRGYLKYHCTHLTQRSVTVMGGPLLTPTTWYIATTQIIRLYGYFIFLPSGFNPGNENVTQSTREVSFTTVQGLLRLHGLLQTTEVRYLRKLLGSNRIIKIQYCVCIVTET